MRPPQTPTVTKSLFANYLRLLRVPPQTATDVSEHIRRLLALYDGARTLGDARASRPRGLNQLGGGQLLICGPHGTARDTEFGRKILP